MAEHDGNTVNTMITFMSQVELNDDIVYMDCSDCDSLASLAERVAQGEPVQAVLPALEEHFQHWNDCREEFYALVAVLRAESSPEAQLALDELLSALKAPKPDSTSPTTA